jgi:hypothetical protein
MRPSLIALAAICAFTLGLRAVAQGPVPQPDLDRLEADLVARLAAAGLTAQQLPGPPLRRVIAQAPGCELMAAAEVWHGARSAAFAQLSPELGPLQIHYHGWVDSYPRLQPLVGQYFQRHLASYGVAIETVPVILVAAGPGCDLADIDFASLRLHMQR